MRLKKTLEDKTSVCHNMSQMHRWTEVLVYNTVSEIASCVLMVGYRVELDLSHI